MNEILTNDTKANICRDDFYLMLQNAMLQAGGGSSVDRLKLLPLSEVVDQLAQNGIRMVYMADRHMDSLSIEWKTKPNNIKFNLPPGQELNDANPPKKRQLLCDIRDARATDDGQ
jgi:hypothetical protein